VVALRFARHCICILAVSACAPSGGAAPLPAHASYNRLTAYEMSGFRDVYAAVRDLRGLWFTGRSGSPLQLRIFVDGVLTQWLESLASITVDQVIEVRYLTAYEATRRYGALLFGASLDGAIEVITRR